MPGPSKPSVSLASFRKILFRRANAFVFPRTDSIMGLQQTAGARNRVGTDPMPLRHVESRSSTPRIWLDDHVVA